MSEFAISALSRKRAELAGECEVLQARLDQMRCDLAHLDAAMVIMDPDADPGAIRPKRPMSNSSGWFGRGELQRLALDTIRTARTPPDCREIALALMARRNLDAADAKVLARVQNMVSCMLRRCEGRLVRRVPLNGASSGWSVEAA